jgi:predicted amidohydrolase
MSADQVTVAVCQLAPVVGEVDANRERLAAAVRRAAEAGADVVVAPELATSGYVFHNRAEIAEAAEPADGPTSGLLGELARELGVTVVAGIPEQTSGEDIYNSAVVVDRSGLRAVYRKVHLWGREPEFFRPGDEAPPVLDLDWGRLGLMICYDLEFPEWVRQSALAGAELICAPTNWPHEGRPDAERPIEMVNVLAAASANRVFIAAADRCGEERGTRWVAGSLIAGHDGYPLAMADLSDTEQMLLATCEPARARDKALGPFNDRFGDRRRDLYR